MTKSLPILSALAAVLSLSACGTKNALNEAKNDTAANEVRRIKQAAEMYMVHEAKCPDTVQDLKTANMLEDVPEDPWRKAYSLSCTASSITVVSGGPDGVIGGGDDISSDRD